MEAKVIRLAKATGLQLQEAAREARLGDVPNEVYGLYQAIYCSQPSPMQEQILRKGLKAAGWNYLKITECARVATEVDRLPPVLSIAVANMAERVGAKLSVENVAAKTLYRIVPMEDFASAFKVARELAKKTGFKPVLTTTPGHSQAFTKTVRVGKHKYTAVVEADGINLRLSAYKGV